MTYSQLARSTENRPLRTFLKVTPVVVIILYITSSSFIFDVSMFKKISVRMTNHSQVGRQFHTEIDSPEQISLHNRTINIPPLTHSDITNLLEQLTNLKKKDKEHTDVLEIMRSTNKNVIKLSVMATDKTDKSTDKVRGISSQNSTTNQQRTGLNETNLNSSAPLIPNVVHYVWFGENWNFTFLQYLCFVSVSRYINPDYIFIHGDNPPAQGVWWDRARVDVPNIYFVRIARRTAAPNGQPFKHIEHATDIERIIIILTYGGIYLDTDVLMVKSVDCLRYNYSMVMGRETVDKVSCGIIMAKRGEPFLSMWLECYKSYLGMKEGWSSKSTVLLHQLAKIYPHLIHVEERSMTHPNWEEPEVKELFEGHYDWSSNYAVHIWKRTKFSKIPQKPAEIDNLNTTFGEVLRHIYYGSQKLRSI